MGLPFTIVDVFAEERYAGNQLGVVTGAGDLDAGTMQRIAREFNFSETTFVTGTGPRDGAWDMRVFTPEKELPFAGHPMLGTAWVIINRLGGGDAGGVTLRPPRGEVPVSRDPAGPSRLWMRQFEPTFGPVVDRGPVAAALCLAAPDLDAAFPCREVSTGLPFVLAPLTGLDALGRARPDAEGMRRLLGGGVADSVLAFCRQTRRRENDLAARCFAVGYGVTEDPATGSANGCLAAWLLKTGFLGEGPVRARVEQGYEMGRPSLLHVAAERTTDGIAVRVGGEVVPVARGELL